ncbi:MAG: Type-2 restriction enzyme BsuMI component YdjA [Paraeggerthella hongkongensis]
MRQVFVKELSTYTEETLSVKLGVTMERAAECVEVLATHGVLKLRTGNDPSEYDASNTNGLKGKYQFVYVGLTIFEDLVLVVFPKYMDEDQFFSEISAESRNALQRVFRVVRKSSGAYSDIATLDEGSRRFNDRVALMLMLVEMYSEFGEYSNYVRTLKTNGMGEISWERTVAVHQPFISGNVPVYFEYETIANTKDDSDFVTRLHRCVLSECSTYLQEAGLNEMLGLEHISLSDELVVNFGDAEHICQRLDRERGAQYVTWKLDVIDLIRRYISEERFVVRSDEVVCLGSTSFYQVWEKACKVAFGDLLEKRLSKTGIDLRGCWRSRRNDTMLKLIPSPQWSWFARGEESRCDDVATLVPDAISVFEGSGGSTFAILDAKYYTPVMGKSPKGMPGVDSVTKQILYQRAYEDFVVDNGFSKVINAFLVPCECNKATLIGRVDFPGVLAPMQAPFANHVDMWALPADDVWRCYLEGRPFQDAESLTG